MTKAKQATAKQSRTTRRAASEMKSADTKQAAHRAAEHLAQMMESDDLPEIVTATISDFVLELSNRTQVGLTTPDVLRVALPLMLAEADRAGWRVNHNSLSLIRDDGTITTNACRAGVGSTKGWSDNDDDKPNN
jgi:hypothetical protein